MLLDEFKLVKVHIRFCVSRGYSIAGFRYEFFRYKLGIISQQEAES